MALPGGITMPVIRPDRPPSDIPGLVDRGLVVKTNRTNQGSWGSYLDAIRKNPGSGLQDMKAEYERPGENNPRVRPPQRLPVRGRGGTAAAGASVASPTRSNSGSALGASYGAGQTIPAGTPEANYAAGIRRYGAGMRSAPNIGAVRNKGGYNERDRRLAAQNSGDRLATGDALNRVRLLGG